jgi:hypothetical protein
MLASTMQFSRYGRSRRQIAAYPDTAHRISGGELRGAA